MKTQVELLKECCDIKDAACVKYQKRIKELEEENKKLKSDLEQFSEAYKRYRDFEKEELAESCYDLEEENKKLKEENERLYDEIRQYEKGFELGSAKED